MASITLTIPDAVVNRVIEAMCAANGLEVNADNAKLALVNHIKNTTIRQEELVAEAEAAAQVKIIMDTRELARSAIESDVQAISIV